jgi:hypothetical protein
MDELTQHLQPENERKNLELHNFGEVTRILYRNLYAAASGKVTTIRITSEFIEFYKDSIKISETPIHAFKNARISFREKLVKVLQRDQVLSRHIHITQQTSEEIIAELDYE